MSIPFPSYLLLSVLGLLGYKTAMATDLKAAFQPYTDQWGLVQPQAGSSSGNGLLYTAEAIAALKANNQLTTDMKAQYWAAYEACEVQPGLFHRRPDGAFGQNQQDDYIGIAYAARHLDRPDIAQRVLDYGDIGANRLTSTPASGDEIAYKALSLFGLLTVKNVYNDIEPGAFNLKGWFARWPFLGITMKFAAGKDPNILEKLFWCVIQLSSLRADVNNQDNWILSWMAWKTVEGKSWITDLVGKYWLKKFVEKQGSMGDLLERYFNDPNQPVAQALKGVY